MVFDSLLTLHKDLIKSSKLNNSKFLLYGSFFNGRASTNSDIDIMEYLDITTKARYAATYSYLESKALSNFEISGTYGNFSHFNNDIDFTLKTQPLVILMSTDEIKFIIKKQEANKRPTVITVHIRSLSKFVESL